MEIVGYKSLGHDGTVSCIEGGALRYSIEAEKDSNDRHATCSAELFEQILSKRGTLPGLVCSDSRRFRDEGLESAEEYERVHYKGIKLSDVKRSTIRLAGRDVAWMSVPHELSHLACSFALSDLAEGEEFYALCWEGWLGKLYHVDRAFNVTSFSDGNFMNGPGIRYTFPFHTTGRAPIVNMSAAGKIMALAGLHTSGPAEPTPAERELLALLLDTEYYHEKSPGDVDAQGRVFYHRHKEQRGLLNGDPHALYSALAFLNGKEVDAPEFTRVCRLLQDGIYERFSRFAEKHVTKRLPLLISGGCGLNCEWNSLWRQSPLFSSVFVPPVTNDSGIAIGAAAVGQYLETGRMKLDWSAYAGEDFVRDAEPSPREFAHEKLDSMELSRKMLEHEWVVAWVQGRYEVGPRALCHRSLLAAPLHTSMRDKLNRIKKREHYRPVAPVCREENVSEYFDWQGPSPYMLYFQRVLTERLAAVTHFDGSARVQTVSAAQEPRTHHLLGAFKELTGMAVLCNTSLNFLGKGFINRMSDLIKYVQATEVAAMVVGDDVYVKRAALGAA